MRISRLAAGVAIGAVMLTAACTNGPGGPNADKGSSGSGTSNATFTTIDGSKHITPGAPANPYNLNGNVFTGYNVVDLAWSRSDPTDINKFYPALASSWEQSADLRSVTVHLDPKAGWSDGTPVTAKDVVTSFAAGYVAGNTTGINLGTVTAVDDHTVKIKQLAGSVSHTFLLNVLTTIVVPAAQYGSLLPSDIWTSIDQSQGSDAAKAKTAQASLDALTKKLTTFAPKTNLSAGPFVMTGLNPGEATFDKNPHFYAADKVAPSKLVLRNYSGNEEVWNYLQSGQLDYGPFTAMPTNIQKAIEKAGNKMVSSASFVQAALGFNQSVAPFGDVRVRRAFGYLLDRKAITKVGEPVGGMAVDVESGMVKAASDAWMDPATAQQLQKYAVDKAKAEQLFTESGLKKGSNGKWQLADGKPFTVTLQSVTGFSDWIAASNVVCSELTTFGVPCQVKVSADYATYQTDLAAQKFSFAWWLTAVGTNPPSVLARIWGAPYGYTVTGSKATYAPASKSDSGNWVGGPQEVVLPDGSKVKPGELTASLASMTPDQQRPVIQQLFLAENTSLPMIGVWDYTNVVFVNETRFTKFPDGSDPGLQRLSPGVWMAQGFIQPK